MTPVINESNNALIQTCNTHRFKTYFRIQIRSLKLICNPIENSINTIHNSDKTSPIVLGIILRNSDHRKTHDKIKPMR